MHIQHINIKNAKPYTNNAKLHPQEQIEQIKAPIQHVGFLDPISIDENGYILEGHGRYIAAKQLGYHTIPKKPKARPATKPTEPGTLEQNPENP